MKAQIQYYINIFYQHSKYAVQNLTLYKIMENSLPHIINMKKKTSHLGRWQMHHCNKKQNLNSYYANTDHCGDYICGNPEVLKSKYPNYYGKKLKQNYPVD
jgi:hypothetical protein